MLEKLLLVVAASSTIAALHPRVLTGTASDDSQNSAVMLFRLNAEKTSGNVCTAALVAPRLLLTARHCIADVTDGSVACLPDGTPIGNGGSVRANFNASDLYVFTGKDRAPFTRLGNPDGSNRDLDATKWQPAGRGAQVLDDLSGTLCNHDIAFVVLEAPITNVPIAKLRLGGDPKAGEELLNVGYGITSTEFEPPVRQQRRGVTVKQVGPHDSFPILAKNEFSFTESICEGDSGGPIFSAKTGAVLGVVSRGSNGQNADRPGATCPEADNIGTKLPPFREMLDQAFAAAGAKPQLEPAEDDGCAVAAVGSRRSTVGGALLIGLAFALLARRRRQD